MRRRWSAVVLATAGLASLAAWYALRPPPPPEPPGLDARGLADPELAAAVGSVRAAVRAEPGSGRAWGRLGQLFLANGYGAQALPCLDRAAALQPDEPRWPYLTGIALLSSDPDEAVHHFERAVALAGDTGPRSVLRLRLAESYLRQGRAAEAERLFRVALEDDPDDLRAHFGLGVLARERDDAKQAVAHLLRAADSPFARQRAAAHLAALFTRTGDTAAAARFRKRAGQLPRDPEWPDPFVGEYVALIAGRQALFFRAEHLLRTGQTAAAAALLSRLHEDYPEDDRVPVKLGMALAQLGDYRRAERVLRSALSGGSDKVQARYFLAVALYHQAELLPGGAAAARQGFAEAGAQAASAVSLKPDHAFAHLYRGLALRRLGRPAEALAALRAAVRYSPESADPHLHLGEALWEAGEREEARAQLRRAVELASEGDSRPQATLERVSAPAP